MKSKNIKHQLSVVSATLLFTLLTACGGGGGGSDSNSGSTSEGGNSGGSNSGGGNSGGGNSGGGNSGGGNSGGGNSGGGNTGGSNTGGGNAGSSYTLADPVTPLTIEATTIIGTKQKAGFSGDIEVIKKSTSNGSGGTFESFEYQLANGMANLNINDVKRVESTRFDCPASNTKLKGKGSGLITYNYKAGKVVVKASNSGFSVDCTYTIPPYEGGTISNHDSIKALLEDWGEDYEKNATKMEGSSCPKPAADTNNQPDNSKTPTNEELAQVVNEILSCNIEIVKNYTVTDDSNKVHKVAKAGSVPLGMLFILLAFLYRRFK